MRLVANIRDSIGRRLAAFTARYTPPVEEAPQEWDFTDLSTAASFLGREADIWKVAKDRAQRHKVRERMDTEDGVVSKALDVLADVATAPEDEGESGESFSLECQDERARVEAETLSAALHLQDRSWEVARRIAQFGNDFFEIIVDSSGTRVVRYKLLPEEQLWRNFDPYGLALVYDEAKKVYPWEQRQPWQSPGGGIGFAEWQVVHYTHRADERNVYGRGILDCERDWMRLQQIEDDMVRARQLRAYDKLVHKIPVRKEAGRDSIESQMKRYKRDLTSERILNATEGTARRDNPTAVEQDFFIPSPLLGPGESLPGGAGVERLAAENAQLQNIRDVEYLRSRLLARLGVPMRYLNMAGAESVRSAIGEGGISYEDIQFARTIRQLQRQVRAGHIRVLTFHLILRGYDPIKNPLSLSFPIVSTADVQRQANIDYQRAQTLQIMAGFIGIPPEMIVDYYMGLSTSEKERWYGENMEKLQQMAQAKITQGQSSQQTAESLRELAASTMLLARAEMKREYESPGTNGDVRDLQSYPAPVGS